MKLATAANYQEHGYITAEYDSNSKIGTATAIINNEAHSIGKEISNEYTLTNIGSVTVDLTRPTQYENYIGFFTSKFTPGYTDNSFVLVKNLMMGISTANITVINKPDYLDIVIVNQSRYIVFTDFPETKTINLEFAPV